MREIKFRAWDTHKKRWLDGHLFNIDLFYGVIHRNNVPGIIRGYEVMQYTGLKDKNGKESFESDIAKDMHGQIFVIEWNYTLLSQLEDIEFEIIGNIHENPELL